MPVDIYGLASEILKTIEGNPVAVNAVVALLSALLGAGVEYKWKIISVIKASFKSTQTVSITDSPASPARNAGHDLDDSSANQGLTVHGDVNAPITMQQQGVGTEADALERPEIDTAIQPTLTDEQQFFSNELNSVFQRHGGSFTERESYVSAERCRRTSFRVAAECYFRVFSPLIPLLEAAGDEANAAALRSEIAKLEVWVRDNHNSETVDIIAQNIERVLWTLIHNQG